MGNAEAPIRVELAWSPRAGEVQLLTLAVPRGTTIAAAIACSGWELPAGVAYGVFGKPCDASHVLGDGDRLELLRPLAADPKDARRRRERQARPGATRR